MQIPSSIALALSHGANDAQKSMGLISISLVILGFSPSFHVPWWVVASCAAAIALGTATGRMENHQDHGLKNLSPEVRSCILCSNFLGSRHFRGCTGGRSGLHDTRRFFQHHGCWSWSEDLSRPVGRGEEYHPGLVYHHPSLSGDGRIEFFYYSVVVFICLSSISIKKGG